MALTTVNDLDYIAARLHGRRSRLMEKERLDTLCRLHSVHELATALFPGTSLASSASIQQRLVQDLIDELH
ncbi:MAG: hypothetical protein WCL44_13975, partial [bacterium]